MIRTKPFKPAQRQWMSNAPECPGSRTEGRISRLGGEIGAPERGREKEGTHSRKLLDASHKHLAQTPRWDAGQQAASSKLMGRAGRVNSILGHMCVGKEAGRESK